MIYQWSDSIPMSLSALECYHGLESTTAKTQNNRTISAQKNNNNTSHTRRSSVSPDVWFLPQWNLP